MNRMVISAGSDERGTSATFLRKEPAPHVGLAPGEDQRTVLFNEIEK